MGGRQKCLGVSYIASYGFRLVDSTLKGDSRGLARHIGLRAMSRESRAHGDSLQAFERGGVGSGVFGMSGRHRIADFQVILAFGAWSHHLASVGDDSLARAMDRTILEARPSD
jgi:hypothetical protein